MLIFLILVLIIINLYQVVIGSEATLSVVGANGAVRRHSNYLGNHGGAGGVIQILASSGLVASGSRLWLRKGTTTCKSAAKDSEDGFLLIKGARLIQIYLV